MQPTSVLLNKSHDENSFFFINTIMKDAVLPIIEQYIKLIENDMIEYSHVLRRHYVNISLSGTKVYVPFHRHE